MCRLCGYHPAEGADRVGKNPHPLPLFLEHTTQSSTSKLRIIFTFQYVDTKTMESIEKDLVDENCYSLRFTYLTIHINFNASKKLNKQTDFYHHQLYFY